MLITNGELNFSSKTATDKKNLLFVRDDIHGKSFNKLLVPRKHDFSAAIQALSSINCNFLTSKQFTRWMLAYFSSISRLDKYEKFSKKFVYLLKSIF